jgi:hypothetical protein
LPASAPDRFASKTDRAPCAQAAQDALLPPARPRPEKFAERFFAGHCQRFLKIANDRQREPTISRLGQRSTTPDNDRRWRINAFPTHADDRQGSGNDRQRQTTIGREKSTHFQRSPTQKWTMGFPSGVVR